MVNSKKYGAGAKKPKFSTDADAEAYLAGLLERGLFFRAKKIVLKKKKDEKEKEKATAQAAPAAATNVAKSKLKSGGADSATNSPKKVKIITPDCPPLP